MIEWIAFGVFVGGPVLCALALAVSSTRASTQRAAARYGRRGYEALDREPPPAPLGLRPDGSVVYLPASSSAPSADAPTGPITGILPTYRGDPL